jgi:hypothetical protein
VDLDLARFTRLFVELMSAPTPPKLPRPAGAAINRR